MSDTALFKYRIFFKKEGRLALLSHLEVARALERAIRRACLPFAISQGYSPHMKLAFGSALPVGVGGSKECFDLQLTHYCSPKDILAALQEVCAADLMVYDCRVLGAREPAASLAYPISSYCVRLSAPLPETAPIPSCITVIRKKKQKELLVADFLVDELIREGSTLSFALLAKPTGSLRPDVFVQNLIAGQSELEVISITRTDQKEA